MRRSIYKLLGLVLATTLTGTGVANANHNTNTVVNEGTEATWEWRVNNDLRNGIVELTIYVNNEFEDELLGDGYDTFGYVRINGANVPVGTATVRRTFANNWVQWEINVDEVSNLEVRGNMGCDGSCVYVNLGGRLFNYQENRGNGQPLYDPIFSWETDGTVIATDNGTDNPRVIKTGTSLTFKHRAYAYINDQSVTPEAFLTLFAQWVEENPDRTDIFTNQWVGGGSAFIPLSASTTSPVSLTAAGSTLTCSPGQYSVGDSTVDISSFIYKLYVNGEDVSSKYPAELSANGAKYDLAKISDYSARCEVTAVGFSSSITTSSSSITDSVYKTRVAAAQAAKSAAEEAARSAATEANFTQEAREMRKRIAARQP